jgi:hypothetical protein
LKFVLHGSSTPPTRYLNSQLFVLPITLFVKQRDYFNHPSIFTMLLSSRLFLALVVSWATRIGFVNGATECWYSEPVRLSDKNGELYVEQFKEKVSDTYTMRLTFIGGNSWIGIGINTDDLSTMTPSSAVIGRVEDDGNSTSVLLYNLKNNKEDASGVKAAKSNSLQNASFKQPDENTSILTFSQNISEMGAKGKSTWIYAVGLPDNAWGGKHKIHGSLQLKLSDNCVEVADPTSSPTANATDPVDDENDEIAPPLAPLAETAAPTVASDTSALSGSALLKTTPPYKGLWVAHGVFMALAWGILAPLGIGASILRELIKDTFGQSWYNIHLYLNMSTVVLTAIGFLIALIATETGEHFKENSHKRAGLVIMLFVVMQALAGYFRPAPASETTPSTGTSKPLADASSDEEEDEESAERIVDSSEGAHEVVFEKTAERPYYDHAASTGAAKMPKKRLAWEWGHRLGGMLLVGLAWSNCHSGIQLQVEDWEEINDWTGVFWGFAAGISCCIFILAVVKRTRRPSVSLGQSDS